MPCDTDLARTIPLHPRCRDGVSVSLLPVHGYCTCMHGDFDIANPIWRFPCGGESDTHTHILCILWSSTQVACSSSRIPHPHLHPHPIHPRVYYTIHGKSRMATAGTMAGAETETGNRDGPCLVVSIVRRYIFSPFLQQKLYC